MKTFGDKILQFDDELSKINNKWCKKFEIFIGEKTMDLTLIKEGLVVMAMGMGTVFVFLAIMIGAMNLTSLVMPILNKFMPEEIEQPKSSAKKQVSDSDSEIALAIACALRERGKAC